MEGGGGRRKRGEGAAGCSYLPVPAETVARHPVCRGRRKMKSVHTITALTNRTVVAGLIPALHPAPAAHSSQALPSLLSLVRLCIHARWESQGTRVAQSSTNQRVGHTVDKVWIYPVKWFLAHSDDYDHVGRLLVSKTFLCFLRWF